MGYYSDVTLVVKSGLFQELIGSNEILDLFSQADRKHENSESIRFDWDQVQWYEDERGIHRTLHETLEELNDDGEEYYLSKVTKEDMYDDFNPFVTWGNYVDTFLHPSYVVEREVHPDTYKSLKKPYTVEEVKEIHKDERIQCYVEVYLDDMMYEQIEFYERISEMVVEGGRVYDLAISIVKHYGNSIVLKVDGDVSEILEEI